jgi:hypothetical protein
MATGWSEIINKAAIIIDDDNWTRELNTSPARFFRAKSDWVTMALPLLNRPPNLQAWIKDGMTNPAYDTAEWVSDEQSTDGETTVATGLVGYAMVSVTQRSADGLSETPYSLPENAYDPETGNLTFPQQTEEGTVYEIDAYTDGTFRDLDYTLIRLFSLAVSVVWDERLDTNWLNDTMKIKDSSFETEKESTYMNSTGAKRSRNRAAFQDEIALYEQNSAYLTRVPQGRHFTALNR